MQRKKNAVVVRKHWLLPWPSLIYLSQVCLFLLFTWCFQKAGVMYVSFCFFFFSFLFLVPLFQHALALTGVTVGRNLILNIKGLNLFQKSVNKFTSVPGRGQEEHRTGWMGVHTQQKGKHSFHYENNFVFNRDLLDTYWGEACYTLHALP